MKGVRSIEMIEMMAATTTTTTKTMVVVGVVASVCVSLGRNSRSPIRSFDFYPIFPFGGVEVAREITRGSRDKPVQCQPVTTS